MRRLIIALSLIMLLLPVPAYAVPDTYVPSYVNQEPILLPDSPLYFLKTVYETFRYALAFTPKKKVDIGMFLAERRLQEAKKVTKQGNEEQAAKLLEDYRSRLGNVQQTVKTAAEVGGTAVKLSQQAKQSFQRQKEIMDSMGVSFDTVSDLEDDLGSKVTTISATLRRPYRVPEKKQSTPSADTASPSIFGTILNWLLGQRELIAPVAE